MTRRNFPASVMVACVRRATREVKPGVTDQYCEACALPTKGRFQIDHINPDGLTGEPTLANAMLLCVPCHKVKTAKDVKDIAKAKRREADHLHVRRVSARPMRGPSFPPSRKRKAHPVPPPPRRSLYEASK